MAGTPPVSMFTPQDRPRLAPSVDREKYMCCKCRDVLRPPVRQTSCGHRLCLLCLDDLLMSSNTLCPGQDLEEEPCADLAQERIVSPDFGTERDLKKLPVLCDYEQYGCRETPAWNKKSAHVAGCYFRPQGCPNARNGCTYQGTLQNVQQHAQSCEFAPKRCEHCRKEIPGRQYEVHVRECRTRPQDCPLTDSGCTFKGLPVSVRDHSKQPDTMAEHINLLQDHIRRIEIDFQRAETERVRLQRENEALKSRGPQGAGASSPEATKLYHQLLKTQAKLSERQVKTDTALQQIPSTEQFNQTAEKLASLQDVSKMQESRLSQMEQGQRGGAMGLSDDERNKLRSVESTVGMHDIRLAEYDLRFQCMESAGYDGTLIWKIKDYNRRKHDAVTGRTLSLYSQPFYTSRFGYKMCARVYLNGDGMGKGSHMSLFFVLMKGDYDALMPWPFRQKVSLSLMDVDGGRKPLTDTFRPDPTSTSFRQPVGDMNIASGCPLFVAQSTVETRTYLKDDTVYIKVVVDSSDINLP